MCSPPPFIAHTVLARPVVGAGGLLSVTYRCLEGFRFENGDHERTIIRNPLGDWPHIDDCRGEFRPTNSVFSRGMNVVLASFVCHSLF